MAKKSLFYKIYFSTVALFLVLLVAGLFLLYAWLKAYEQARPETVIQNMYTTYIKKGNLYGLKKLGGLTLSPYETEKSVNSAFKAMTQGKKTALATATNKLNAATRDYVVTVDGEALLTVQLKKQGKAGRLGIRAYAPSEITLANSHYKTVKITAPANAKVSVNGIVLSEDQAKKEDLPEVLKADKNSKKLIVPQSYKLENLLNPEPEITATEGKTKLNVAHENGQYAVGQALDTKTLETVKSFALEAAQAYAAYMQNDAALGKVGTYMDKTTDFYKNLKTSMVMFAWEHNGYSFENSTSGNVFKYSETVYRCRVSFVQTLKLGAKTYQDPFDQYVYLRKSADGWKVIDMLQYAGE